MKTLWLHTGGFLLPMIFSLTVHAAGGVSLNGNLLPLSSSSLDTTQDVTEFREGGNPVIQLIPGAKRYSVCIATANPVAVLDAELPVNAAAHRFTVRVEDGREFGRCVVASLKTNNANKQRYRYCLRCEDVTTP